MSRAWAMDGRATKTKASQTENFLMCHSLIELGVYCSASNFVGGLRADGQ